MQGVLAAERPSSNPSVGLLRPAMDSFFENACKQYADDIADGAHNVKNDWSFKSIIHVIK